MNVRGAEGRGGSRDWGAGASKDPRLQISYLNESFRKERRRESTFLFSGVFCFLFFGVMSFKSIYYSTCSVFKCNLRKKRDEK